MAKEQTYSLNCDKCGGVFQSEEGFPNPQLCPTCPKRAVTCIEDA